MTQEPFTTSSRATRSSVSTVLIVGLLIGATVSVLRPGIAPVSRDGDSQRLATRHLAQTLARAVRELARADRERPGAAWVRPVRMAFVSVARVEIPPEEQRVTVRPLRESLLALPPPVV